jgi:hypothetical protein
MQKSKVSFNNKRKTRIVPALILSLAMAFTVAFFVPVEIYVRNSRDFVIGFGSAALPMLLLAVLSAAVIFAVLYLLPETLYRVFSCLGLGLLLASYVQMLFFNGDMKALTGDEAGYGDVTVSHVINAVIWAVIFILPLLLLFCVKKKPSADGAGEAVDGAVSEKADEKTPVPVKITVFGSGKITAAIAGVLFAMQLVGFVSAYFQTKLITFEDTFEYFSYEALTHVSKENNIVVFLADRMGGPLFEEMVEKYPELNEQLAGFTFYSDNLSRYGRTFPSVINMLTRREYYGGQLLDEFLAEAWKGRTFIDELHENGFAVNLFMDQITTYNSAAQLHGIADNIVSADETTELVYFGKPSITYVMLKMSFGKLLPYLLKDPFIGGLTSFFSDDFFNTSRSEAATKPEVVSISSDIKLYDYLSANMPKPDSPKKTFSFIHLNGSHDASLELSALYEGFAGEAPDGFSTTRGIFSIIDKYLSQLKEQGVYDDTTVVILSDHGYSWEDNYQTASLLIKPKNADTTQKLKIDGDAKLSNAYFAASVLDAAGIETQEYGPSYFDLLESGEYPTRFFSFVEWWNRWAGKKPIGGGDLYEITGDSRDDNNWKKIN